MEGRRPKSTSGARLALFACLHTSSSPLALKNWEISSSVMPNNPRLNRINKPVMTCAQRHASQRRTGIMQSATRCLSVNIKAKPRTYAAHMALVETPIWSDALAKCVKRNRAFLKASRNASADRLLDGMLSGRLQHTSPPYSRAKIFSMKSVRRQPTITEVTKPGKCWFNGLLISVSEELAADKFWELSSIKYVPFESSCQRNQKDVGRAMPAPGVRDF